MKNIKNILFLYKTPRKKILKDWQNKKGPDTTLYGANQLEKMGYEVSFFDYGFSRLNIFHWLFLPLHLLVKNFTGLGFNIEQAIILLPRVLKTDLIVSTVDSAGLPLLLMKKIKVINKPVIYCSIDFADRIKKGNTFIFKIYKCLLKEANIVICYSNHEEKILKKINKNTFVRKIGVDTSFYRNIQNNRSFKNIKILSFGRDTSRDYRTLINAVKGLNKIEITIVCSRVNIKDIDIPRNALVKYDISANDLRNEIQKCDIVVIPIKNTKKAAGQLSTLDSMASGKPIIIPKINSFTDFYKFKNRENCIFYKAESETDLERKISLLVNDSVLRKKIGYNSRRVALKYSTINFAKEISDLIKNNL